MKRILKLGAVFAAMLFISMAFVSAVIAAPSKSTRQDDVSENDAFDISEIQKRTEGLSEEEMKQKYREAVREAQKQKKAAMKEADAHVSEHSKPTDDSEIYILSSFYHRDYYVDGSYSASGGSWIGYSEDWTSGNEIHTMARAEGPYGAYWAYGKNWDQFTYTASDHWCQVTVNYRLNGLLFGWVPDTGDAYTDVYVYLRVYDMTTGTEITNKLIFSNYAYGDNYDYYDQDMIGQTSVYLKQGHTYRVELIGDVFASAWGVAGGTSDFATREFDGSYRMIRWNYDEVIWV